MLLPCMVVTSDWCDVYAMLTIPENCNTMVAEESQLLID